MLEQPYISLIIIGYLFKAAGLLMRESLWLRIFLGIGIAFDFVFFIVQSPFVSLDVLANLALFAINLALIAVLIWERSTWGMTKTERVAFTTFKTLSPGQFRQINRKARWTMAPADTVLLREDEPAQKLFFLETKGFSITKQGETYEAKGPAFLGEIMMMQGGGASATVTVPKGAIYAEWHTADLHRMMKKSRALDNALAARFGHDMADKLRNSVPIRAGE
mgnify:CR=1 FL=1